MFNILNPITNVFNWFGNDTNSVNFNFEKIFECSNSKNITEIILEINSLCTYFKINKDNQIELYFYEEKDCLNVVNFLKESKEEFAFEIEDHQIFNFIKCFKLQLTTDQSIALLGIYPCPLENFEVGCSLLKEMQEIHPSIDLSLQNIQKSVQESNRQELHRFLQKLCGQNGYYKINEYNGNYQFRLVFEKGKERSDLIDYLKNSFEKEKDFLDLFDFNEWQLSNHNGKYALQLMTNQSVALLSLDFEKAKPFEKGQELLAQLGSFDLKELVNYETFFSNMCTYLPIKDLESLRCTCKTTEDFLKGDRYVWKLVASSLGMIINETSNRSFYEQIKKPFTTNLEAKVIELDISYEEIEIEDICRFQEKIAATLPEMHYIHVYIGWGMGYLFKDPETNEVKGLRCASRFGNDNDDPLIKKMIPSMTPFKIVPINKEDYKYIGPDCR
jgi:hypothetical protein